MSTFVANHIAPPQFYGKIAPQYCEVEMETGTAVPLAQKVLEAKSHWEIARLRFDQAQADLEYAEKKLLLAKRELDMEVQKYGLAWQQAFDDEETIRQLGSVAYVGDSINRAAQKALAGRGKASLIDLVGYMRAGGFIFATDAPARELHAALMKQPWARKDTKRDVWEFIRN
jgi:hypothetical protein